MQMCVAEEGLGGKISPSVGRIDRFVWEDLFKVGFLGRTGHAHVTLLGSQRGQRHDEYHHGGQYQVKG